MIDIKNILIGLVIVSMVLLGVLFFQDNTKKLEDRSYKEINKIIINSETANIAFNKSEDEKVRVVVYGAKKDKVELIEGTKSLIINQESNNSICFINCYKKIEIYVPDKFPEAVIKTDKGNIDANKQTINNVLISTNKGNISLYKTNIVNIISDKGNVSIDEINATKDSIITTNTGNININKIINLNLDIKTDFGNRTVPVIKNKQKYTLKIETNTGNIDIDSHEDKS